MKFLGRLPHLVSILVLLCGLASVASSQNPPPSGRVSGQANQQQTGAPAQRPDIGPTVIVNPTITVAEPQTNSEQRKRQDESSANWWASLATWVIAGLTFLAVGTGVVTVRYARRAFILTHRPRIMIRNVVMPSINQPTLDFVDGTAWITNTGETRAIITKVWHTLQFYGSLPMQNPATTAITEDKVPIHLKPGEVREIALDKVTVTGLKEYGAVSSGRHPHPERHLYLVGFIEYRDEIGTLRRTYFCRKFDPESRRFTSLEKTDPDYEYAD